MDKVLEKFYSSILDYSGLVYKDDIIQNKNERLGEFSIEGKFIALPYQSNLKNPNNRVMFHLLNENFIKPDNPIFNLYKKRLICEVNLKLVQLFTTLSHISVSVELQSKITDVTLLEFLSEIKDVDMVFVENLVKIVKYSKEVNEESFFIDLFLKKNGDVNGTPYAAIGKVNFLLYEEVKRAMSFSDKEYRIFNCKVRKKDVNILFSLFNIIFPQIEDKEAYIDGTDNKVFRYLNMLLKTAYMVTSRVNELVDSLETIKDETLDIADMRFNHDWVDLLEELYGMTNVIRMIPNQTDLTMKDTSVKHIKANESVIVDNSPQEQAQQIARMAVPVQQVPMAMAPVPGMQPPMMTGDPDEPDSNKILKSLMGGGGMGVPMQQPMMPMQQQYMQQPMQQPQQPMPMWMRNELTNQMQPQAMVPIQQQYQPYPNMGYPMQQQYNPYSNQPTSVIDPRFMGRMTANF